MLQDRTFRDVAFAMETAGTKGRNSGFTGRRQASQRVDPGLNIRNPTQTQPEGCQTRPDLAGPNQNPGYPNSPNYLKVNFVNLYRSKI